MQTVADVIEFWNAYFDKQNESRFYPESVRVKGAELIADDAEYWSERGMYALMDRANSI